MNENKENNEPNIGKTVIEDLKRGDFRKNIQTDFNEMKEYFLTEERKERLKYMGHFKGLVFMVWWILTSMYFKLTPSRRVVLLISILLLMFSRNVVTIGEVTIGTNFSVISAIILLFILMLELKDKLLARSELEIGHSVQVAMMPESMPEIPGWNIWIYSKPAKEVGGDLVDYQKLDDTRYGASLGDVAGKGLGAALLMVKLQSTLRALAPDYSSISEFIEKINNIFYRDSSSKSFASMAYLELKTDSDSVRVLNAGHMPPVVIKGINITEIKKSGPAIGLMPNIEYEETIVDLHEKDTLFLYSDGLTEARNEEGEFFGEERLMRLLRKINNYTPRRFGEMLLEKLDEFSGAAIAHDDLSIIIIKRNI